MKDAIFKIFDIFTEKADFYTNEGYLWLIFTDEEKWVIRLKDGYLLYNYYFFKDCFKYVSLDVVENQQYITEWVEGAIQNGVKRTTAVAINLTGFVEDAIQNGVKHTYDDFIGFGLWVEETIQNGVKHTSSKFSLPLQRVEDIIQNGVKHTFILNGGGDEYVEDTIQNGVKITDSVVKNYFTSIKNNITYN